jgi:peptide/nickel transport system substrate-binding protein
MSVTRRDMLLGAATGMAAMTASPGWAQTPKRGGTLRSIINPEPPGLILGLNQLLPTMVVAGKITQSLLRYGFDLKPLPSLAKSWTISPDGLVYTFTLQDNVKWHDGTPFTSADVVFTTTKFLPETHARWRAMFEKCASITAPDAGTVVFTLKQPFSAFLYAFLASGCPMMPRHIYEGTDFRNNPANATPIGTGPFKLKEWKKGSYIHLVRNDDYWKPGLPYLDEIFYNVIPDGAQRVAALESGRVDMTQNSDVENFEIPRLREMKNLNYTTHGNEAISPIAWLDVNLRLPKFQDKRVRKAMLHAIDRQFIIDNLFFGLGHIANGPIASTTKYYDDKALVKYPYDPARAIALLDEAGLKPNASGVRLKTSMIAIPYGEVWTRQAEFIKQQFSKVGIDLTIEATDAAGFLQRNSNWDFELCGNFLSQFMEPAIGVARNYVSSNIRKGVISTNVEGYSNPAIDDIFAKAAQATSEADAQKLYSEAQHIISDELPVIYLTELEFANFVSTSFHDVIIDASGCVAEFDQAWKS